MTEQQQKLYDKLLKKVNEFCLGQAAEDVIAAIDDLVDTYEDEVTEAQGYATRYAEELKEDPTPKPLENLKELEMWATNGYTACDVEKAKELIKPIENSLKALEIIKKHKLLNYVLRNPKCAEMYHLSKEEIKEIEFLKGSKRKSKKKRY